MENINNSNQVAVTRHAAPGGGLAHQVKRVTMACLYFILFAM